MLKTLTAISISLGCLIQPASASNLNSLMAQGFTALDQASHPSWSVKKKKKKKKPSQPTNSGQQGQTQ